MNKSSIILAASVIATGLVAMSTEGIASRRGDLDSDGDGRVSRAERVHHARRVRANRNANRHNENHGNRHNENHGVGHVEGNEAGENEAAEHGR